MHAFHWTHCKLQSTLRLAKLNFVLTESVLLNIINTSEINCRFVCCLEKLDSEVDPFACWIDVS